MRILSLHGYVYIYIYIYAYTYVCVYIHMYAGVYVCTNTHVYMYVSSFQSMHSNVVKCVKISRYVQINQSVNQSISQSVNQSISQSIPVHWTFDCFSSIVASSTSPADDSWWIWDDSNSCGSGCIEQQYVRAYVFMFLCTYYILY